LFLKFPTGGGVIPAFVFPAKFEKETLLSKRDHDVLLCIEAYYKLIS
jgi:hypothetical protein